MKISKLFHWLYAILIMLPVFAIGGTMLYCAFNKNAYQSYAGNKIVKNYTTNEVNSRDDIIYGNMYHIEIDYVPTAMGGEYSSLILDTPRIANAKLDIEESSSVVASTSANYDCIIYHDVYFSYVFKDITKNSNLKYYGFKISGQYLHFSCDAIIQNDVNNNLVDYMETGYVKVSASDFLGEILFTENTYSLDNSFYYAVNKVQTSPVFSWAYNSFLVAPFQYIMALFGMPSNHIVVELLSYWLAVSIIWLVFDLIMYVPLLAHRWLDKGILE